MDIKINHQETETTTGALLSDFVSAYTGGSLRGIAVAVNGKVVPRDTMAGFVLQPGDTVRIIKATQGG